MALDIIVLVILLFSTGIAFFRGFIREALTVVTLILSMAAAHFLGPLLEPAMGQWIGIEQGADPGKFLGVIPKDLAAIILSKAAFFFGVMIALSITTHFFAEYIKSIGLGAIDRSMGALFGFVRALLVVLLLYLPLHILLNEETKQSWFDGSKSYVYLESGSEFIAQQMPEDFIQEKFEKAQETVDEAPEMNKVRAKLQEMNLLGDTLSPEEKSRIIQEKYESGELQKFFEEEGYDEDFRNQIDLLFQNVQDPAANLNE